MKNEPADMPLLLVKSVLLLNIVACVALMVVLHKQKLANRNFSNVLPNLNARTVTIAKKVTDNNFFDSDQNFAEVPKIVVLTHATKTNFSISKAKLWQELNPEYDVVLYDNDMCKAFLNSTYGSRTRKMFEGIRHGPIKADMFRVFYLFHQGGVYADIDMVPIVPLKSILRAAQGVSVPLSNHSQKLNPTIIAAPAQHDTMRAAVDVYYELANGKYYSYWSWSIVHVLSALQAFGAPLSTHLHELCPSMSMSTKIYSKLMPWVRDPAYDCVIKLQNTTVARVRSQDYDAGRHTHREV